jgi:putative hemolysin
MDPSDPHLSLRLATTEADRRGAERLRYEVFVEELGGDGALVDHDARLERDRFDPFFDHLILVDDRRDAATFDHVVGVYRVMTDTAAARAGQFYSEDEYDLTPLRASGRRLLELGRSCVHPDHRGGAAMFLLWSGLADYVLDRGVEVMFGVASFHGTDTGALALPLSYLHHTHLAPPDLRVRSRVHEPMDLLPKDRVDRLAALQAIPPLIKAYLRLGGVVGDGAFIDRPFNTTDVCLVMDTARMNAKARDLYARGRA